MEGTQTGRDQNESGDILFNRSEACRYLGGPLSRVRRDRGVNLSIGFRACESPTNMDSGTDIHLHIGRTTFVKRYNPEWQIEYEMCQLEQ
jgi:hypothetical protein